MFNSWFMLVGSWFIAGLPIKHGDFERFQARVPRVSRFRVAQGTVKHRKAVNMAMGTSGVARHRWRQHHKPSYELQAVLRCDKHNNNRL